MKKLFMFGVTLAIALSFSGIAMAEASAVDDGERQVVGEDIDIADDEMKVVSVDEPVVGDDLELGEDEAGIVSVDEPESDGVVGDDLELGEDEAGIISVDEPQEDESNLPLAAIISTVVLVGAGLILVLKKVL